MNRAIGYLAIAASLAAVQLSPHISVPLSTEPPYTPTEKKERSPEVLANRAERRRLKVRVKRGSHLKRF